jgi:hypothetical protein
MSTIAGRHNGKQLFVDVSIVSAALDHNATVFGIAANQALFSEPVKALIDTGSTATSISPLAVQRLNLRSGGKRDMMTANGPRRARYYDFRIGFYSRREDGSAQFHILEKPVSGVALNVENVVFDILLGMDVISQGDLIIRRDGSFTFEF